MGATSTLIWSSAGIALAALIRFGPAVWPGLWLGAFVIGTAAGVGPGMSSLIATGNTLAQLLGVGLLRRYGLHPALDRRRDLWLFGSIGIGVTMALTAANAVGWAWLMHPSPGPEVLRAWQREWLRSAISAAVFGIPLLAVTRDSWQAGFGQWRWVATLLAALAAASGLGWSILTARGAPLVAAPLALIPHLLLGWLAARRGLFAASLAALGLSIVAAASLRAGAGALRLDDAPQNVVALSGYLCSLLAIPLLITALIGELAANESRWQIALDTMNLGLGEWDLRAGRVEFSPRWLAMLGFRDQDFGHSIQSFWSRVHDDDALALQRAFEPLRTATGIKSRAECRLLCADGRWRWFELHAMVIERNARGEPVRVMTTARDIGEQQAARERQQLSDSLFKHLHEGLLVTDDRFRVLDVNRTFSDITGVSREELFSGLPEPVRPAAAGESASEQREQMRACLLSEGMWRGEVAFDRHGAEPCILQVTISVVRAADGSVQHHVIAISDVTEKRRQSEQLQRQAHSDELTRLPNRVRLAQMLEAALAASRRDGLLLTVCSVDLDHFKPVNDRLGRAAGDRLLVELADRMRTSLRARAGSADVVSRIGGDEFVLLLRTATLEESRHAVERMLRRIAQPLVLGGAQGPVNVTASIGATVFPFDAADAETLLRHASQAMVGAKQAGRNGYLFFDAEYDRRTEARFVALGRVQAALDGNEFRLYFQPKVDMRLGRVLGMEALLRWKHPDEGVVSPAQFLPLIENTGLGVSVGKWVFEHGIETLARWLRQGFDFTLSINASARQLQEPLFVEQLAELLARYREPVGTHLIIEVLETAALADIDYTCGLMQACQALGVRFALDDFGTGYSTFTYLKRLPLDMLKIDRSFVTNMLHDRHDMAIVEGVVGLSRTFGCSIVAEGVETPEQAVRLIAIGCDVGQGNGIAAAMPADDVSGWVQGYRGMLEHDEPVVALTA